MSKHSWRGALTRVAAAGLTASPLVGTAARGYWGRLLPATVPLLLLATRAVPGCEKGDGTIDGDETVESQARGTFRFWSFSTGDVLRDAEGNPVEADDPTTVGGWDLALSQWVLATNSGDSAQGDGESTSRGALLAVAGETESWADLAAFDARCSDFASADEVANGGGAFGCSGATPTVDEGYVPDALDDPDGAGPFPTLPHNPSLSFWFEYHFDTHEVDPYGHIYVIETWDGRCVKVRFTDYYDEGGESGFISFSWAWLPD